VPVKSLHSPRRSPGRRNATGAGPCTIRRSVRYLIVILLVDRTLNVTVDNGFDVQAPAGNVNTNTPDCFSPLNNPNVTGPVALMFVGFFATPTNERVTVEVAFVFHVSFSVPLVFVAPPASNDLQLLASPNFRLAVSVALVTPLPTQPPTLPFLIVTVGLFFVVLATAGSAGENVAVPVAVLHTVPADAPAGEAISPIGNSIAVASKTPANFPLMDSPVVG
jgi:hypothetical protein